MRDLDLPKKTAMLLASRLHQCNLLLPVVKISKCRTHENSLLHFIDKKEHVFACIGVNGLMDFMNIVMIQITRGCL
ncbi:hypothetical protein TNCT_624311 [Trichonephila clavata]|uniref:Uncharacterized protein n=1 Tax=Trichonephila clavata TaxID=2740835 RepID=A0A8X6L5Y5_TRICU|nr:hypothetical protein TNCT_624311 [Trichonephila clavata]